MHRFVLIVPLIVILARDILHSILYVHTGCGEYKYMY